MTDLVSLLEQSMTQHATRIALRVDDLSLTYQELQGRIYHLAHFLSAQHLTKAAVLGYRSVAVESTLLSCFYARTTYVPLNPIFPHARCGQMMANAQVQALILCPECLEYALGLTLPESTVVVTDDATAQTLAVQKPEWQVLSLGSFATVQTTKPALPEYQAAQPAYIIYTSGTTGEAKGVVISYHAVANYMDKIMRLYQFKASDVFSQMFDITFDMSVHDLLSSLLSGGTLVPIPKRFLFAPTMAIAQYGITVFHSVPSVIGFMEKFKLLKPGLLPQLRLSLFVGEPLWYEQVRQWAQTCPNATIVNTYGPTETTIIIATYTAFDPKRLQLSDLPEHGVVPLGTALERSSYSLRDEQQQLVPDGALGEIYLGGDQLGAGYYGSPQKTAAAFVTIAGERWYRTGDLGRIEERNGQSVLTFCGRCNDEVKVNGYRVSLLEVDECLQALSGVRALALPVRDEFSLVHGLIGVLETDDPKLCTKVQKEIGAKLPFYMAPKAIRACEEMPLNSNGKLDRKTLLKIMTERGELTLN
ncbi:MAG TPA: AMP-binding protein [Candidatus Anaerobiospirillum stercoravium]|nr:AMP-binding protein [Candidatus Anaerobiospirillum stercoravium]